MTREKKMVHRVGYDRRETTDVLRNYLFKQ